MATKNTSAKNETLILTKELINRPSVTPLDEGCQKLIAQRLESIGFTIEHMPFEDVENLWARKGDESPVIYFAGHTDVVPPGPQDQWSTPAFSATEHNGILTGRGTADMKSSLAAMVTACERFTANHHNHKGSIAFLITSDEEGVATNGTVKVLETLKNRDEKIHYCVIGEPTSERTLCDVIKNGRRGSMSGTLLVKGIQGHIAYPQKADNPIHKLAPALSRLSTEQWDNGNEFFPPTSFQISNIHSGDGTTNMIPGECKVLFNFRFSTESTVEDLQQRVANILDHHKLAYTLDWSISGQAFLTPPGELVKAAQDSIRSVLKRGTELSTSGGTSDGRFIASTGAQILEIGPCNETAHKIDESIAVTDLEPLSQVYEKILENLLLKE